MDDELDLPDVVWSITRPTRCGMEYNSRPARCGMEDELDMPNVFATSLEPKLATSLEPKLATSLEPKLATSLEAKLATSDGRSKCSKFESGLRPKLKRMFRHQVIADFATLVNKCRMYEDDLKADELATPKQIFPGTMDPNATIGKEGVRREWGMTENLMRRSLFIVTEISKGNGCFHCKEFGHIKRFCPKLDRRLNVIHTEEARDHGRKVTQSGAGTSGVDGPARGNSLEEWGILPDSRLSERTSPKREDQCFEIGNSGSLAQARNELLEREEAC
ncbi:hypothetical protein Lal_00012660 [Lupinus albus]|nr:hypothetical protein Lal_00012660 [Lupinus albus]